MARCRVHHAQVQSTIKDHDAAGQAFQDSRQMRAHPSVLFQTLLQAAILILKFMPEPGNFRMQFRVRGFERARRLIKRSKCGRECPA